MNYEIKNILKKIEKGEMSKQEAMEYIKKNQSEANINKTQIDNKSIHKECEFIFNELYLMDHKVFEKQVLLGVTSISLYIEAIYETGKTGYPYSLRNVQFIKPVILEQNECAHLTVSPVDKKSSHKLHIDCSINNKEFMVSTADFSDGTSLSTDSYVNELRAGMDNQQIDSNSLYNSIASRNIKHGDSLKTVIEIYKSDEVLVSKLKLTNEIKEATPKYEVHPAILDGAISSSILLATNQQEGTFIPFMVKKINVCRNIPNECFAYIQKKKSNSELFVTDITLIDENGSIYLKLEDVICKHIRSVENLLGIEETIDIDNMSLVSPVKKASSIEDYLTQKLITKLPTGTKVNKKKNFMELGVDSMQLIELCKEIENEVGIELYPTLFFEYENLEQLTVYLTENYNKQFERIICCKSENIVKNIEVTEGTIKSISYEFNSDDIAIIGMSGRYADSDDLNEFFENILSKNSLITEIPKSHFDYKPWYDNNIKAYDKLYCKWGSFIDDVDKFDADFFQISKREAEVMDPQMRLLLEEVYHTSEDAGYSRKIKGSNTGMYVGVCFHDYQDRLMNEANPYTGTGNAATMIANRASFFFDLKGPSVSVDTACSSSLVAVHLACQALNNEECDMVFVAGVNLLLSSWHYRYFSSIGALSPTGRCHTFDRDADGYVPGEGIGVILLKPLKKALKDGDRIHAVIKGSAINHGGYSSSITAPNVKQEVKVMVDAWNNAGISPDTLGYIEAHGTGTKLGDPIEVNSMVQAFKKYGDFVNICAIGSVKSNIGHTEGAAGVTGIIKNVMSMKNKVIPAMPEFKELNPYIIIDGTPLYINKENCFWQTKNGVPRRAGVSSFGFGGTYAHVVLEEFTDNKKAIDETDNNMFLFSAQSFEQLKINVEKFKKWLSNPDNNHSVSDICLSLKLREQMEYRLAFVADDKQEAVEKISMFLDNNMSSGINYGVKNDDSDEILDEMSLTKDELLKKWVNGGFLKSSDERICDYFVDMPKYAFAKKTYWKEEVNTFRKNESYDICYYTLSWVEKCLDKADDNVRNVVFIHNNTALSNTIIKLAENKYDKIYQVILDDINDNDIHTKEFERIFDESNFDIIIINEEYNWLLVKKTIMVRLLNIIKDLLRSELSARCRQIIIAGRKHDNIIDSMILSLSSIGKSLVSLNSNIKIKSVLFNEDNDIVVGKNILAEASVNKNEKVYYKNGTRYTEKFEKVDMTKIQSSKFKKEGIYWIAGGNGALGLQVCNYLISEYNAFVILSGRSSIDDDKNINVKNFVSNNERVIYIQCDIAEIDQVNNAIEIIKDKFVSVNGIINTAGYYKNTKLDEKLTYDIYNTMNSKIDGTIYLVNAAEKLSSDFVLLYGSISAHFGDMGLCDYSLANSFLDEFTMAQIEYPSDYDCPVYVIDWPIWQDGNMHGDPIEEKIYLKSSKQSYMTYEYGMKAIENILVSDVKQISVVLGEKEYIDGIFEIGRNSLDHEKIALDNMNCSDLRTFINENLKNIAAILLKCSTDQFTDKKNFGDYGFESITFREFADEINNLFELSISPTLFFKYNKFSSLTDYLIDEYSNEVNKCYNNAVAELEHSDKKNSESNDESDLIAIIGMSGLFPGGSDLNEFWNKIVDGQDMTEVVPGDRWDWNEYYCKDNYEKNKSNIYWGAFISDYDKFDAKFFNILPQEAILMDPQQRLFLEYSWNTIEDAGYSIEELEGKKVGVFAGTQFHDYEELIRKASESHAQVATGTSRAMIANRVSYMFDFHGPSETIDTACSSSLVAVYRAMKSIQSGECELAIAGGVSLILSPDVYTEVAKLGVLSPTGKTKAFDEKADGYVRGEGIGVILMKPLKMAIKDKDHIYGCIRSAKINHGGHANTLTTPNLQAQSDLLLSVYHEAGIDPRHLSYIEAHGTGTSIGDPIEIDAINNALSTMYKEKGIEIKQATCGIGTIKSNIGHLEPASGMAGIFKVLMSMKHGIIPRTININKVNPLIKTENVPYYIVSNTIKWDRMKNSEQNEIPRMAGISSFGFGGTNAHILVQEYIDKFKNKDVSEKEEIIFVSAKTENALKKYAEKLVRFLNCSDDNISLHDVSYTLRHGRNAMAYRLAFTANSTHEMKKKLEHYLNDNYSDIFVSKDLKKIIGNEEIWNVGSESSNYDIINEWINGKKINWLKNDNDSARRISLPTYPFEKTRFWIEYNEKNKKDKFRKELSVSDRKFEFNISNKNVNKDLVGYELKSNGVAIVSLKDKENYNLLGIELYDALKDRFFEIHNDPSVKVVVVTGYDNVFSMGGAKNILTDISNQKNTCSDADFIYKGFLMCKVPVISAMQGHAQGGGLTLGLSADVTVMSNTGMYSSNFAQFGFTPGVGTTFFLIERFGTVLANEMMYTAASYYGSELRDRGACVIFEDKERVLERALEIADKIAKRPIETIYVLKKGLASKTLPILMHSVETENNMHNELFKDIDVKGYIDKYFAEAPKENISSKINLKLKRNENEETVSNTNSKIKLNYKKSESSGFTTDTKIKFVGNESEMKNSSDKLVLNTDKKRMNKPVDKTLVSLLNQTVGIPENEIRKSDTFQDMGVDSINAVEYIRSINHTFKIDLEASALYDYVTINDLSKHIKEIIGETEESNVPEYTDKTESTDNSVRNKTDEDYVEILHNIVADSQKIPVDEISTNETFTDLGLDSINLVEMVRTINHELSLTLEVSDIYEHSTIKELAAYIKKCKHPESHDRSEAVEILNKLSSDEINIDKAEKLLEDLL